MMSHFKSLLAMLLIMNAVVAWSVEAPSSHDYSSLSDEQFETLISIKKSFSSIEQFLERQSLTLEQAEAAKLFVLLEQQKLMAQSLPLKQLRELVHSCEQDERCREKTVMDKFGGIFSFINIVWFLASVLIIVGIIAVLSIYRRFIYKTLKPVFKFTLTLLSFIVPIIARFFKNIPLLAYELLLLSLAALLIYSATFFGEAAQVYVVFIGNVFVVLILSFLTKKYTILYRDNKKIDFRKIRYWSKILLMTVFSVLWAATAIVYQSQLLGFFTIAIILSWLGFGMAISSLEYSFGFKNRKTIFTGTVGALVLLLSYIGIIILQIKVPYYIYFENGIKYLGSFVFYSGLLISSSKWVCRYYKFNYGLLQVASITAGIAALFLGSVFNMAELRGFGGTFFVLYLIEKQFDFVWHKKRIAWLILLLGITLFAIAQVVSIYPEFFFMATDSVKTE